MSGIVSAAWADGQLPSSKGTLYTVPGAHSGVAVELRFANTSGSAIVCQIWLNTTGTDRLQCTFTVPASGGSAILKIVGLPTGTVIKGAAGTAAVVDYVILAGDQT